MIVHRSPVGVINIREAVLLHFFGSTLKYICPGFYVLNVCFAILELCIRNGMILAEPDKLGSVFRKSVK